MDKENRLDRIQNYEFAFTFYCSICFYCSFITNLQLPTSCLIWCGNTFNTISTAIEWYVRIYLMICLLLLLVCFLLISLDLQVIVFQNISTAVFQRKWFGNCKHCGLLDHKHILFPFRSQIRLIYALIIFFA